MKFSDLQYPSKIWPLVNRRGAARHPGALHPEAPRQLEQDVFIPPSLLGTRRLVARRRTFLLVVLLTICLHSFVSSGSCFHFTFELAFPTSPPVLHRCGWVGKRKWSQTIILSQAEVELFFSPPHPPFTYGSFMSFSSC